MKLHFKNTSKSITQFECSDLLPNLTVLYGINGAGKTHLLEAIRDGQIVAQEIYESGSINLTSTYFSAQTLVPKPGTFSVQNFANVIQAVEQQLRPTLDGYIAAFRSQHGSNFLGNSDLIAAAKAQNETSYQSYNQNLKNQMVSQIAQHFPATQKNPSLLQEKVSNFDVVADYDISCFDLIEHAAKSSTLLESNLSAIFVWYRRKQAENWQKNGRAQGSGLSEMEFVERYGVSPWEMLDSTFRTANLPFRTVEPPEANSDMRAYEFRLFHLETKQEVKVDHLSSGEKTLCALVVAVFSVNSNSDVLHRPNILLLDEIDAFLHPGMVKFVLDALQVEIIEKLKIRVVLTTHSPTTAALCPENSLYLLSRNGSSVDLKKSTREEALTKLLVGVPNVTVSYERRRQVFCESHNEAKILSRIFNCITKDMQYQLNFIGIGNKKNGGCDTIKEVVGKLRNLGSQNIFGTVDWDNKNEEKEGIFVAGHNVFYSAENGIFHPAALAAYIVRNYESKLLLETGAVPLKDTDITPEKIVELAKKVTQILAPEFESKSYVLGEEQTLECSHGFTYSLNQSFLHLEGHEYEKIIRAVFPFLKRDDLKEHLVNTIFRSYAFLIPKAYHVLFDRLCQK